MSDLFYKIRNSRIFRSLSGFYSKHNTQLHPFLVLIATLGVYMAVSIVMWWRGTSFLFEFVFLYTIYFILFYLTSKVSVRDSINRHAIFISILGILIPVNLFFFQAELEANSESLKQEVALKEENNRNMSHLQSVITDLERDPNTVFWREFSIESYAKNWDHIQFTKEQECRNLYAALTIQLGAINNINRMRQQLILVPNNLWVQMMESASSTKPVLDKIIGHCQV